MNQEQNKKKRISSGKKIFLGFLFCIFLLIGGVLGFFVHQYLNTPIADPGREEIVSIPKGLSFDKIATKLQDRDIIKSAWKFRLLARIQKKASKVQAGEFRLHTNWTAPRILETLTQGQAVLYKLSIPEGLPWWEVAGLVQKSGLSSYADFAFAIKNQSLLKKYNIPASTAEGYLFPETYHLPRPEDKDANLIVGFMLKEFWQQTRQKLWPADPPDPDKLHRLVILASLIEKETSIDHERAKIAGVFVNRLKRNMRLQCDPTIIYGMGKAFDGNITKKNLRNADNAYNTYRHAGLPPGPICSPGLESLKAAFKPQKHEYLYFVSKGDKTHHFSKTLTEHNRAVRKYQLGG